MNTSKCMVYLYENAVIKPVILYNEYMLLKYDKSELIK